MGGERVIGLLLQHQLAVDDDHTLAVAHHLATLQVVSSAIGLIGPIGLIDGG